MFEFYDKWNGLIPVLGGIYGLLLVYSVLPRHPKDPERLELWHRKFGKMMKILCPFLIIFGIWSLAEGFKNKSKNEASIAGLSEKFQIVRNQAGQVDASGWVPAYSTNGGFFVYMPAPFNEVELPSTEMDDEKVTIFAIGTSVNGTKFTAQFWKYENGIPDIHSYKDMAMRGHKWSKYFTRIEEISLDDKYPLLEMEIKTPKFEGTSQVVITEEGMYLLAVEYQKNSEQNLTLARRFFDSFKIKD